ncbi:MAG TPA: glycosyltransferase [Nitrososphaeraceae archaeon]|nr:glycosyltransferase [Nitrososphaeraceae archaeon]
MSHEGLPDWRIEKSAISASKLGHEVVFAGRKNPISYNRNTFLKIYEVNWTAKARLGIPFYWHAVKKQIEKIIKDVKPDIIHAHNIFSAKMISEFGFPFVYDDHEYWSRSSRLLIEMAERLTLRSTKGDIAKYIAIDLPTHLRRISINKYSIRLWTNWEKELVSSTPTITISNRIAEELRLVGNSNNTNRVFVVPNFPMKWEVQALEKPYFHTTLSSAYAGGDGHNKEKYPNRNMDGLTDIFTNYDIGHLTIIGWEGESAGKVRYTGFVSRQAMYNEMSKHSIGLIPWKKHWSHVFTSPNKPYEYAHAGLFVMCTSCLKPVSETLKENCITFENYNDLVSQLKYFKENLDELYNKRLKIFEFARNSLIWENYEKNIFRAYQLC